MKKKLSALTMSLALAGLLTIQANSAMANE